MRRRPSSGRHPKPYPKPVSLRLRTTIPLHPRKQTYRSQQPARSRKHRRTSLGELHVGPALVQPEPAVGDGAIKAGLVFRRRALELIQKGLIDLLDIDPAVLDRLECVGELKQFASGGLGISKWSLLNELHGWLIAAFPRLCEFRYSKTAGLGL